MAQHYPITDEKITRSITRIAHRVYKDIKHKLLMDWAYWGKDIHHLPSEYNPSGHAFTISPYNMKKVWKDEPHAEERASLEVHLDSAGTITAIYYPL